MQYVGRFYVPFVNRKYGKSGSLWEGWYKASLVQEETYLLTCMRYIEMNPVRANLVKTAGQYRWSSYRSNAQGEHDELISQHELYQQLGTSLASRQEAYRALFKAHMNTLELNVLRSASQTGTPLGNDMFREKVEATLQQKVGQARRGRPSKAREQDVD